MPPALKVRRPGATRNVKPDFYLPICEPGNWLHPSLVIQGYFEPDYRKPKAVAIARMEDVIRIIAEGRQGRDFRDPGDWYLEHTKPEGGHYDNTHFAVIPIETLVRSGMKHIWREFP